MALHRRHNEDPFETYDLKKKRPAGRARRKLRSYFSANFNGGKLASVAVPVIAFVLLVSVFVVKIITDSKSVSDEKFRNENPVEMQDNIGRIQRDNPVLPEIDEPVETKAPTTEPTPDPTAAPEKETEPGAPNVVVMTPEETEEITITEYLYIAGSAVNVREDASTGSDIIGQLSLNQKVGKIGEKNDFIEIKTDGGLRGYVHKDLVSTELSEAIVPGMTMYVQVGQAYIRSGAGTTYDIIGFGFKGTPLTIVEAGSEWSLVRTETGLSGYMMNELFGTRKVERTRLVMETNAVRYVDYPVVYMREEATADSEQIGVLAMDDRVLQISTDGSWSKVEASDGLQGYVRNDLLRESAPITPFATTNRNQYISVSVSNIRAEANTDSEVIGQARKDEQVLQIETDGTWSRIKNSAGVEGYVLNEFLTVVVPAPPSSSTGTTTTPTETTPPPSNSTFRDISGTVYIKTSAANLRSEPNTSSLIVDTLYYGAAVERISTNDVWTKVKTANGQIGFVDNSLFQTEVIVIESTPPQATSQGQQVVEYAKQLLGVPYVYAGASANGVDCSGLTKYVYGRMGVYLYHGSNSQARSNYQSISFSTSNYEATLLPGDLVFFNNVYTSPNSNYTHVGIYVGNGQMIHSPQPGQTVRYESLYDRNAYSPVRLVKRIF